MRVDEIWHIPFRTEINVFLSTFIGVTCNWMNLESFHHIAPTLWLFIWSVARGNTLTCIRRCVISTRGLLTNENKFTRLITLLAPYAVASRDLTIPICWASLKSEQKSLKALFDVCGVTCNKSWLKVPRNRDRGFFLRPFTDTDSSQLAVRSALWLF